MSESNRIGIEYKVAYLGGRSLADFEQKLGDENRSGGWELVSSLLTVPSKRHPNGRVMVFLKRPVMSD